MAPKADLDYACHSWMTDNLGGLSGPGASWWSSHLLVN